jgi:hypothetical protein
MAPYYGNLILAEAEHHLRHGNILEAGKSFEAAMEARAFRDTGAAQEGLRTLTEWKLIAEENGIDWRRDSLEAAAMLADAPDYRAMPAARVNERNLAGEAIPEVVPEAASPDATESPEPAKE